MYIFYILKEKDSGPDGKKTYLTQILRFSKDSIIRKATVTYCNPIPPKQN